MSDLSDRVADLTTTLVELQYDQVDGSLLSETRVNLEYSRFVYYSGSPVRRGFTDPAVVTMHLIQVWLIVLSNW